MEIFTRLIKRTKNIIREEIEKNDLNVKKKEKQNLIDGVVKAFQDYSPKTRIEILDKISIQILYETPSQ